MSLSLAQQALARWDIPNAKVVLAAERENMVFQVTNTTGTFALRLHRQGYRSDAELASELHWMAAVKAAGISAPQPIAPKDGAYLQTVEGRQFDMLTWLPGRQMGQFGTPLNLPNPKQTFETLGKIMARLHLASDAWTPPVDFTRPAWDCDGLIGETPLWGRFWENPNLTPDQRDLLDRFRQSALNILSKNSHDFGLIHADLLRENVLVDGDHLHLIDFDDGGTGFRVFELATTLFRIKDEHNYPELKAALIAGYHAIRPLDLTHLHLFMALRACTYVGWIATRTEIPNAAERNLYHIENAVQSLGAWLKTEA